MEKFGRFYLDNEKDIIVDLYRKDDRLFYVLSTPNHHSGNLITNLAKLCQLPISFDEKGLKIIEGEVPCYVDAHNRQVFIFRLANTKVANIYPDGSVEMKATIPALPKTLMSQTKEYTLDANKTIVKTYIVRDWKFETDLHTHTNGNLHPDILIALGIVHQIRYPLYYIHKLQIRLSEKQQKAIDQQRSRVERQFADSPLQGKYLNRKIDDNTFINLADLILNNPEDAYYNIVQIRSSLSILKDGQAVFTNLEKVYLYRYVFTRGRPAEKHIRLHGINKIPDEDIVRYLRQMLKDDRDPRYQNNSLFQDKMLWIARIYQGQGIKYVEMSDTTLVKKYQSVQMLNEVHQIFPAIYQETGVTIRFLAAIRRIPLTILKDNVTPQTYLQENLQVLRAVAVDPYVAGCDIVGEEVNSIRELKPVIKEIVKIAKDDPSFVIRVHAGENDSQKSNVADSIDCVRSSLAVGQRMPLMRIGHGLYTANLNTAEGRRLMKTIRDNKIVLEFQITSNVRLNNLISLDAHPLKQYLKEDILCVQGTDGAALYGTCPIDEQLSMERTLELSRDELMKMKRADELVMRMALESYEAKKKEFERLLDGRSAEEVLTERMQDEVHLSSKLWATDSIYDVQTLLQDRIEELPWDRYPIVLMGGSFNTEKRTTKMTAEGRQIIDSLLSQLDEKEVFFLVGDTVSGYERYLIEHNKKFKIFAMCPSIIDKARLKRLKKAGVNIRVSPESAALGIYKSITHEIFDRRPSIVIGFDGNSAGVNVMQEARNGKGKAAIFVYDVEGNLRKKAESLQGYVQLFDGRSDLARELRKIIED
ncbi:MAG: hypothetical protein IJM79_01565 [Erysipelotrichaceae bacterium]|nr:hypothetical protein [Erysipelotrichaceae bacterium]